MPFKDRIEQEFDWTGWRPVEYHGTGNPMLGRSARISNSNSWILNRKFESDLARLAIRRVEVGRGGSKKKKIPGIWHLLQLKPLGNEAFESYDSRVEASVEEGFVLELPAPEGLQYRPYQRAGIAYGRAHGGNVLIGDDMGLGKTIQAIGILNTQPWAGPVLVVCPASLKINWERELQKWLLHKVTIGRANGSKVPKTDIVIINYDILNRNREKLLAREWSFLIGDEIHQASNNDLPRNHLIHFELSVNRRIYLTGTPFTTDYFRAWPIFHALDWMSFPDRFAFAKRYCDAKRVHNGYCYAWDFSGSSHPEELNRALRRAFMVRRMKTDVLEELPAKSRQIVEVSPSSKLTPLLKEEKSLIPELESVVSRIKELEACQDMGAVGGVVDGLKARREALEQKVKPLRQEIGLLKVPLVLQHLRDLEPDRRKLVVFGVHRKVLEAICEAFGEASVLFYGGLGEKRRQEAVDRFQNDDSVRVFVGNIKSAGVGLTLTASSHVVFAEVDHDPSKIVQAEDRCCRIGQVDSVMAQFLLLENSYDLDIVSRFVGRQEAADRALNPEFALQGGKIAPEDLSGEAVLSLLRERDGLLGERACRELLGNSRLASEAWLGNLVRTLAGSPRLSDGQRALVSILARKMRLL